jgi:transposase
MDCQDMVFSPSHSQKRIKKALLVLPELVLKKMLFFSLYLLGARTGAIASLVGMPEESGKTVIKRISKGGLPALGDRRRSARAYEHQLPQPAIRSQQVSIITEGDSCLISFFDSEQQIQILRKHRVHLRSVVLTLLQAGFITAQTASDTLELTASHCLDLSEKLLNEDVAEVLLDKRKGQTNDLLVDLQVKAELVQQFAARSIAGYSVSSKALAEVVNDNLQTTISDRAVRWHMKKLGLMEIKKSLPKLVKSLKKTSNYA